jgi:hypothetical protein
MKKIKESYEIIYTSKAINTSEISSHLGNISLTLIVFSITVGIIGLFKSDRLKSFAKLGILFSVIAILIIVVQIMFIVNIN